MNYKKCSGCKVSKNRIAFHLDKSRGDGLNNFCRDCSALKFKLWCTKNPGKVRAKDSRLAPEKARAKWRLKRSKRRAAQANRTPKWTDLNEIKRIYASCPIGYHVDHIVPLRGGNVCGLHVPNNLQYLPASDNFKKSNVFD